MAQQPCPKQTGILERKISMNRDVRSTELCSILMLVWFEWNGTWRSWCMVGSCFQLGELCPQECCKLCPILKHCQSTVLKSACLKKFLVPELSKMQILVVHDCIWSTGWLKNVHATSVIILRLIIRMQCASEWREMQSGVEKRSQW